MKLEATDAHFWNLIGGLLYCEDAVSDWFFDEDRDVIVLICPGEMTYVSVSMMNQLLKENADYIKKRWKKGNDFDGKLEIK